jgi:hypothetical protein
LIAAAAAVPALAATARAAPSGGGFDRDLYDRWVAMRVGEGTPVYWYSVGTVRNYPAGDTLAIFEGFDTARLWREPGKTDIAWQLSRKTYIFRDPATKAVMRTFAGKPVTPIQYPYQFISYALQGDKLVTMVEQGRAPNVQKIGPGSDISAQRLGAVAQYTAPVYLDFPLPNGGRYEAFENYDFFIQPEAAERKQRFQLSWVRYGGLPPFGDGKPVVAHMVGWRLDRFEDLPEILQSYVESEAPLWRAPPKDVAEIRKLQDG